MRTGLLILAGLLGALLAAAAPARAGSPDSSAAGGAAASAGRYADLRGIRVYYELQGLTVGPALVLLHGGVGNGKQFEKLVPLLGKRFRLIIPDACAQGRTTDRPGPLTYHNMAEDVVALLDVLHVKRAAVLGWSDGGIVGLDLAMHHPDRLTQLVTFGANFRPDGLNAPDVAWNDTASARSFGPDMRKWWQELSPEPEHYEAAMNKILVMWRTLPDYTLEQLKSIGTPALICAGEHDVVRPEHTRELAAAIPGAQLWIVKGASHSVILEKPELVTAKVLAFLGR